MFVLNGYFCRELKFIAILHFKLRFLLRNTGVDSDSTQNFWGKNWRLGALLGSCIACRRKSPVEKKYPESDVKINCWEQRAGLEPDMRLGLANKQGRWLVYCDLLLASSTIQHPKYLCKQFFPAGHWYAIRGFLTFTLNIPSPTRFKPTFSATRKFDPRSCS